MSENKQETAAETKQTPSAEKVVFSEQVMALLNKTRRYGDKLKDTYTDNPEEFIEQLNEFTEHIASEDPEFQTLFKNLPEIRRAGGDDAPAVKKLNEIRARIKEVITSELGLPNEARFNAIEKSRNEISELIKNAPNHPTTPKEILVTLGIRTPKEDENDEYHFPYDLVPATVVEKWKTYLASVCAHVQASESIEDSDHAYTVETADRARKFAHSAVANDMHTILGLEGKENWTWQDTRMLLATIRDHEFPTIESALSDDARELVRVHTNPIHIVEALSARLSH